MIQEEKWTDLAESEILEKNNVISTTEKEYKQIIEKKILKYLISDKLYLAVADSKLQPKFFSEESYQNLYKGIINFYHMNSNVLNEREIIALVQTNYSDLISKKELQVYQTILQDTTPIIDINDLNTNITLLSHLYSRQRITNIALSIIEDNCDKAYTTEDIKKSLNNLITAATELSLDNDTSIRASGSIIESAQKQYDDYIKMRDHPDCIEYIPTGFYPIDEAEGGFRKSELIYVIGRKGTGKSILLLNLAWNACLAGKNILLFSLEISKEDYERRLASYASKVPSKGIKRGNLTDEQQEQFAHYLKNLSKHLGPNDEKLGEFVIIDMPGNCKPATIEAQLLAEQRKRNIKFDVIVVDYAGIMQPDISVVEKRHQQGAIALGLKQLARKHDCAIYSASQMSRLGRAEINQKGGHADSAHIAESDQVADHIDWGIAIKMVEGSEYGILESFKTRDAAPFEFYFKKDYSMMCMTPSDHDINLPLDPEGKNFGNNYNNGLSI